MPIKVDEGGQPNGADEIEPSDYREWDLQGVAARAVRDGVK